MHDAAGGRWERAGGVHLYAAGVRSGWVGDVWRRGAHACTMQPVADGNERAVCISMLQM